MVRRAFEALIGHADAADRVLATTWTACARCRTTCPTRRMLAATSRQAADAACPIRSARTTASPRTTTRCCANSSTASASTTNSSSSTDYYVGGRFDEALRGVLRNIDAIMDVMLPTLRAERRATYSPVLPISPKSGDRAAGAGRGGRCRGRARSRFDDEGETVEQSILGGRRQAAMEGRLGDALGRARRRLRDGGQGPDRFGHPVGQDRARSSAAARPRASIYEMFLDEKGEKISKSKGNGLTIERMADLRPRGEPGLLHLSRAEEGEVAAPRA